MKNNHQFLLYADNILEGITLLNDLTNSDEILSYCHTIYQPIDQPIYVFSDKDNNYYSIKVCGAFDKWKLPDDVYSIKTYVDLPDYILYSIDSKKGYFSRRKYRNRISWQFTMAKRGAQACRCKK